MSKGQIEMIGLLIIVILIVVGGLFYVGFVVMNPKDGAESNVESIQARNLMNAVMNIKLCDVTVKQAVVLCDSGGYVCDRNACDYIETEVPLIVGDLLDRDYAFNVVKGGEIGVVSVGDCEYGINSPSYFFSEVGIEYEAYFKLC